VFALRKVGFALAHHRLKPLINKTLSPVPNEPMLKNFFRAFLVFRLEFRQPALDLEAVLSYWRRTPLIQHVIEDRDADTDSSLKRKLDEVYPF
jgi:hypothetical protein